MRLNKYAVSSCFAIISAVILVVSSLPQPAVAAESGRDVPAAVKERGENPSPSSLSASSTFVSRLLSPDRNSGSLKLTSSYDPNFNVSSLLATVAVQYDHGMLWDQVKSGNTEFKLEASLGSLLRPEARLVAAVNMLALYYPGFLATAGYRPYLEAGIGVIYTDYRLQRQGLRNNFNPQAGIGTEILRNNGDKLFLGLRLNHVSNAGLNHDNQGVNSLLFQIGRFF